MDFINLKSLNLTAEESKGLINFLRKRGELLLRNYYLL